MGYFLTQTAVTGYFRLGSFAATSSARECFLRAYREALPSPLPRGRLAMYMGTNFLQGLPYELWVLRNDKPAIVEPWLDISERGLLEGVAELS